MDKKSLWIGIGTGIVIGGTTGFIIGNQVTKKKARHEIKKVRNTAYLKGQQDAEIEARKVIDELTENVVFVDSTASADEIKKAVDEKSAQISAQTSSQNTNNTEKADEQSEQSERGEEAETEDDKRSELSEQSERNKRSAEATADQISKELSDEMYAENEKTEIYQTAGGIYRRHGQYIVFTGAAGTELYFPKSLMFNERGERLDDIRIRKNFKMYESDVQKLRVVWNALGWGTYIPDLDGTPQDEDIDDWDLSIAWDEPEEKSEERKRYLEKVSKYIADSDAKPKIISRRDFEEETHLDKVYIDYYDVDHVFIENTNPNEPVDAATLLGTSDGEVLFGMKQINEAENDTDPDIVNVENFKMNAVIEVTRYHKAYSDVKDGSAYV